MDFLLLLPLLLSLQLIVSSSKLFQSLTPVTSLKSWVGGHARLVQPASRASMWRFGHNTPPDYEDNEGFCGGLIVQWEVNRGRCGLCGDPYNGAREHEAGGQYATGQVVATYSPGQRMEVSVEVTANHAGHFTFSVCPGQDGEDPSQQCLDNNLLTVEETGSTTFPLTDRRTGHHNLTLLLPPRLSCRHCVLQWTWTCANNWALCPSGQGALGCGPQETFRACADIAILHHKRRGLKHQRKSFRRPNKVSRSTEAPREEEDVLSNKIEERSLECEGRGLYRRREGISSWCTTNCNATPSYCPPSHCRCHAPV